MAVTLTPLKSDPGQDRGLMLRLPCGLFCCVSTHTYFLRIPGCWCTTDGMSWAISRDGNAAIHQTFLLVNLGLGHTLGCLHCGASHVSATLILLIFVWGHPTFHAVLKHLCNESRWVFERNSTTCNLMEWPRDPMTFNTVAWLSNHSECLISAHSPYYKINGVHSNRDRKKK